MVTAKTKASPGKLFRISLCAAMIGAIVCSTTGCASRPEQAISEAFDDQFLAAEFAVAGPMTANPEREARKNLRRGVAVGQAGILLARSFEIDPINRPVSNVLALSSYAWKSTTGLLRRVSLGAAQFPSLEARSIPALAGADGMDLAQWEKDLDKISGQRQLMGTLKLLVDGAEYFPRMLAAVDAAEKSIDIRSFIFDNDDYAVSVADRLKNKSKNARVRIMVDGLGNLMATQADPDSLPSEFAAPLSIELYLEQESKISVRTLSNPWLTGDHTKTTIIDGKKAFVGGMNIGREYRYEWHDLMMEVTGPIVDRLQHDTNKAWAKASALGDLANLFTFLFDHKENTAIEGYPVRALYTKNFDSQIYRAQLAAIRRAASYIWIENAYFSDDVVLYELAKARRRGVDVRVILPDGGNHASLQASNKVAINKMLRNGIRVFQFPGMSHIKAAAIDGWMCAGTANFDKLSLQINKELNLATSHQPVVQELLDRVFLRDFDRSTEIKQELEVTFANRVTEVWVDELL